MSLSSSLVFSRLFSSFLVFSCLFSSSSRGVFSEDELGNFTRLMRRLGRNQILFNRPNALGAVKTLGESSSPASAVSSSESANGAQRHAVAVPEPTTDVPASLAFHRSFIDYCVKNRLPNVLYRYLDYHEYVVQSSIEWMSVESKEGHNEWWQWRTSPFLLFFF